MYKNKYKVKHYTVNELKQLFGDAFAPQKASRESDEQLFKKKKRENYA